MKNISDLFKDIEIAKSNRHYRIGDLIYRRGLRWLHDRRVILSNDNFNNTFLKTYLEKIPGCIDQPKSSLYQEKTMCYGVDDIDILCSHVEEYKQYIDRTALQSDEHTLYIYLRCGDIVQQQTKRNRKNCNIFNPSSVVVDIEQYTSLINNISIVAFMLFGDNEQDKVHKYTDAKYKTNKDLIESLFEAIKCKYSINLEVYKSDVCCPF